MDLGTLIENALTLTASSIIVAELGLLVYLPYLSHKKIKQKIQARKVEPIHVYPKILNDPTSWDYCKDYRDNCY